MFLHMLQIIGVGVDRKIDKLNIVIHQFLALWLQYDNLHADRYSCCVYVKVL